MTYTNIKSKKKLHSNNTSVKMIYIVFINLFLITINLSLTKCNKIKEANYKSIIEKDKYINKCSNDDIYKYEYNNSCYKTCPKGTHISLKNKNLCEKNKIKNKNVDVNKKDNIKSKITKKIKNIKNEENINNYSKKKNQNFHKKRRIETDEQLNDIRQNQ